MDVDSLLRKPEFPLSARYDRDWLLDRRRVGEAGVADLVCPLRAEARARPSPRGSSTRSSPSTRTSTSGPTTYTSRT